MLVVGLAKDDREAHTEWLAADVDHSGYVEWEEFKRLGRRKRQLAELGSKLDQAKAVARCAATATAPASEPRPAELVDAELRPPPHARLTSPSQLRRRGRRRRVELQRRRWLPDARTVRKPGFAEHRRGRAHAHAARVVFAESAAQAVQSHRLRCQADGALTHGRAACLRTAEDLRAPSHSLPSSRSSGHS